MSDSDKKFNIEFGAEGSLLLKGNENQIEIIRENVVNALVDFADSDKLLADVQERKLAKENEQYEALREEKYGTLRLEGLVHAPKVTQNYRENLENRAMKGNEKAIKEMNFFQGKIAYNLDGTVKLLQLEGGKTFCPDITGNLGYSKWEEAKILAESKGYRLLTDWRDSYARQHKEETDWYKLEQYFGEYTNTGAITYMLGCVPGSYWTGTQYNDNYRSDACFRQLNENGSHRNGAYVLTCNRICGLKDSI